MWTVMVIAWAVPLVVLWLWGFYDGAGTVGNHAFLLRTWHRLMTEDPLSTEDLTDVLGPVVEFVEHAAVQAEAAERAEAWSHPGRLAREVERRTHLVRTTLLDWVVGVSQLDQHVATHRLPIAKLRLRRLRLLAWAERPLALVGRVCRFRPATHLATLRWSLRLLISALRRAERAAPARRARMLRDIAADFDLIARDCIASHALALEPFLRWRAALPALPGPEGKWKTPFGWY